MARVSTLDVAVRRGSATERPPTVSNHRRPATAGPPIDLGIAGLARRLRRHEVSSVSLVERALERAAVPGCGFVSVDVERSLEDAAERDRELRGGMDRGPLHGIPFGVKDTIDVAGQPTRLGLAVTFREPARRDASVVEILRRAGAIPMGKTSTPPLAWSHDTPGTVNPRDPGAICGGSSGGSAAVVASGVVPFALGTDTGGSIRVPAALCGVVGLRPTRGSLPLGGVAPLAPSQDTVGPLAAHPSDAGRIWRVLRGGGGASAGRSRRVGLLVDAWAARTDGACARGLETARARLQENGFAVVDVSVPVTALAAAASFLVMLAEASASWPNDPEHDTSLRAKLEAGRSVEPSAYEQALACSAAVGDAVTHALAGADLQALILPGVPVLAPRRGQTTIRIAGRSEEVGSCLTRPSAVASVSGLPAISVPVPHDGGPGPQPSVQLVGPRASESELCLLGTVCAQSFETN